jgi:hypothetical protein
MPEEQQLGGQKASSLMTGQHKDVHRYHNQRSENLVSDHDLVVPEMMNIRPQTTIEETPSNVQSQMSTNGKESTNLSSHFTATQSYHTPAQSRFTEAALEQELEI